MAQDRNEFARAIADAAADAERTIAGSNERRAVLGDLLDRLVALVRPIAGIANAAAAQNSRAAAGALRALGGEIGGIAQDIEHAEALNAATAATVDVLERARGDLEGEIGRERARGDQRVAELTAQYERALAERDRRAIELETLAVTSVDDVLRRCTAFARSLIPALDDALRSVAASADRLDRILNRDVGALGELEDIEAVVGSPATRQPLTDEIAALGADVAPFQGTRAFALDDRARASIAAIAERYHRVREQYDALGGLAAAIRTDRDEVAAALDARASAWMELDRNIQSAIRLFPILLAQDLFTVAGTTRAIVVAKQQHLHEERQRAATAVARIDAVLYERTVRYAAIERALAPVHGAIVALRSFHDVPWFDALPEDARRMIRAAVLAVRPDDRLVSWRALCGALTAARILPADTDDAPNDAIIRPELFAPAAQPRMQARMHVFRLTPLGRYWREAWAQTDPALAVLVADARDAWEREATTAVSRTRAAREAQRMARAAERERAAAEREASAAAEREARANPTAIVRTLEALDRALLFAIAAIAEEAGTVLPDAAKVIAAAIAAGILPADTTLRAVPAALRRLHRHRPTLIAPPNDGPLRNAFAITAVGWNVALLVPSPSDAAVAAFRRLIESPIAEWPHKVREHSYARLRDALDRLT